MPIPYLHTDTAESLFPSVMNHILIKKNSKEKWRGSAQRYQDKKNSRLNRRQQILNDIERQNFFNWIENLQKVLGLNDSNFAKAVNVQTQTIRLWKRRTGHYPSQKSFILLLRLERQTRLEEVDLFFVIRIKN